MANTFPGVNDGAVPFDPQSEVGKFRVLVGDTMAEPYDPPEPGRGNYEMFSDLEIEGFLAVAEGSISLAIGNAYLTLAGQAAKESRSVKDFDLSIDLTKRAADLRLVAMQWFDRADKEQASLEDAFEIADLAGSCDMIPEGIPPRWGRFAVGGWEC